MPTSFRNMWCALLAIGSLVWACTGANPSGVGKETCQAGPTCGGATVQACTMTDGSGQCASITYRVGGQTFTCNSCTDCVKAATDAVAGCGPATGAGGGETCTPGPSCANGSVQACTTKDATGACLAASYKSAGKTFACRTCGDCAQAAIDATSACLAGGGADDAGATSRDSGGGGTACVPSCHSDLECQNSCPRSSNGAVSCCDTSVGACFLISASVCPVPPDSGPPPPPY